MLQRFAVFDFNSAKFDINLMKFYLLRLLFNEQSIEPIVMNKANQLVCFTFGGVHLLDKSKFPGGIKSIDSFLKAYKTSEMKIVFHRNGSMIHKNSIILNFPLTKPSLANCALIFPRTRLFRLSLFDRRGLDI